MNNYKVLFSLKVLKSVFKHFIDIFLTLYFLEISASNILPLGIYKLVAVTAIFGVIFFTRNYCKSKHRVILIRTGIILNFIYFLTIILLKEKVIDYIYLVGLLYGLEEGFYYSSYNIIESNGITNEERTRFAGLNKSVDSILSIIFPLIFGTLIYATGFIKSLIIVLIFVIIQIILSFFIKDKIIPKNSKADLKTFRKIVKENKIIKHIYINRFFTGLTYSEGAFTYIVTIYIIKVFSNSVSLGIFTSIFSLISCVIGLLFARYIKKENYNSVIKVSMVFTLLSLCAMIYNCSFITIVLFNLCQTLSRGLMSLINTNSTLNIANIKDIKKEYQVEYWLGIECSLFIGRVISNTLFILMAFTGADVMIYVFVIFLILLTSNSIKLQKVIGENK